jgi:hypothetical protein
VHNSKKCESCLHPAHVGQCERKLQYLLCPCVNEVTKWTTRDGRVVALTELELGHLQNCIRMLSEQLSDPAEVKTHAQGEKFLLALTAELDRRIAAGPLPETKILSALFRSLKKVSDGH